MTPEPGRERPVEPNERAIEDLCVGWANLLPTSWFEDSGPDPDPHGESPLRQHQSAAAVLFCTLGDTLNGGVDQMLTNSTGALLPRAIQAAELFGWWAFELILRDVMALFPPDAYPLDRDDREQALEDIDDIDDMLAQLDDRVVALDDGDPSGALVRLIIADMVAHPEQYASST